VDLLNRINELRATELAPKVVNSMGLVLAIDTSIMPIVGLSWVAWTSDLTALLAAFSGVRHASPTAFDHLRVN
jgi:hypothetical protein